MCRRRSDTEGGRLLSFPPRASSPGLLMFPDGPRNGPARVCVCGCWLRRKGKGGANTKGRMTSFDPHFLPLLVCLCMIDATQYAHYVFKTFKNGHTGTINFEVIGCSQSLTLQPTTHVTLFLCNIGPIKLAKRQREGGTHTLHFGRGAAYVDVCMMDEKNNNIRESLLVFFSVSLGSLMMLRSPKGGRGLVCSCCCFFRYFVVCVCRPL